MIPFQWLGFLLLASSVKWSLCVRNESKSAIIPPLFRYDNYNKCGSTFCSVAIHLTAKGDELTESNRMIAGYRRNNLAWGVCIADCEAELATASLADQQQLIQPKFNIGDSYMLQVWNDQSNKFNMKYATLLNACVNNRLKRAYNLTQRGFPNIQYCVTNDPAEHQLERDFWTIAFIVLVLVLTCTILITNGIELFVSNAVLKDNLIVNCFAIRRNWARLLEQPNSELYRDFGYIDGLRIFINIFTLMIHSLVVSAVLPQNNPEQVEKNIHNPVIMTFVALTPISVQSFLVITGMLQMINFLKNIQTNTKFDASYFRSKIINRMIRLLPVYYFFLLFTIVCDNLPGVNLSIAGYLTMTTERLVCRQHGWKNLLFINNFPDVKNESCFLHGWYLAADQQLFLCSLALLALIWKFPRKTKTVLWIVGVASIIVPTSIVHYMGLHSLPPLNLQETRFLLYYQPWFNYIYQPGYSNMNATVAGLVVGYLYHQTKTGKSKPGFSKQMIPVMLLIVGTVFGTIPLLYIYALPFPSILNTLHFVLYRNFGIFGACVCFIYCFLNPPGIIRRILSTRLFTSLGKLSYSVYVLHIPLLRIAFNYVPVPVEVSHSNTAVLCTALVVASYALGLVTYLAIEQPSSLLLKHWFFVSRKTKKT
ncbi:nose resistant to fluoxetine protein 6-like isoform X2 [Wyeomyia smithii]|uniref:nose resistant to fluoxetine protein 6-like isoform X2 n=1 Tax=Wyeomyia smithii TaxID=174621 RepID=UPI00246814C1|nr:nose resistant to fluoxetine protein 6-like isoform X2 [Wyeomyia smithii]